MKHFHFILAGLAAAFLSFSCSNFLNEPSVPEYVAPDRLPNGKILSASEKEKLTELFPKAKEIFLEVFGTEDPAEALNSLDNDDYAEKMKLVYEKQKQLLRAELGESAEELIGVVVQSSIGGDATSRGNVNLPIANGYYIYIESSCWYSAFGRWNSAVTAFKNSTLNEIVGDTLTVQLKDSLTGTITRVKNNTARVVVDGAFYWFRAPYDPIPRDTVHTLKDADVGPNTITESRHWTD